MKNPHHDHGRCFLSSVQYRFDYSICDGMSFRRKHLVSGHTGSDIQICVGETQHLDSAGGSILQLQLASTRRCDKLQPS